MILVPKPANAFNSRYGYNSYPQLYQPAPSYGSGYYPSSGRTMPPPPASHNTRARKTKNPNLSLASTPQRTGSIPYYGYDLSSPSPTHKRRSSSTYSNEFEMAIDLADMLPYTSYNTPPATPSPPYTPPHTPYAAGFGSGPSYPSTPTKPMHMRYPSAPAPYYASSGYEPASPSGSSSFGYDRFANPDFQNSPDPKSLPKPKFMGGGGNTTLDGDVFS